MWLVGKFKGGRASTGPTQLAVVATGRRWLTGNITDLPKPHLWALPVIPRLTATLLPREKTFHLLASNNHWITCFFSPHLSSLQLIHIVSGLIKVHRPWISGLYNSNTKLSHNAFHSEISEHFPREPFIATSSAFPVCPSNKRCRTLVGLLSSKPGLHVRMGGCPHTSDPLMSYPAFLCAFICRYSVACNGCALTCGLQLGVAQEGWAVDTDFVFSETFVLKILHPTWENVILTNKEELTIELNIIGFFIFVLWKQNNHLKSKPIKTVCIYLYTHTHIQFHEVEKNYKPDQLGERI